MHGFLTRLACLARNCLRTLALRHAHSRAWLKKD
jgi:hypothetical protein